MKIVFCFSILLFIMTKGYAQVPHQINYQGIARNSVGNVLPNQPVSIRLSIKDGSSSGTVVYSETRNVTTNAFGLFFYSIGGPGATSVAGTLSGVNWANGNKYLQVEIDPNGGSSFTDAGTTQLLSVPYALYAAGASPTGNAGGSLTGTYPNPTIGNGAITLPMIAAGVLPTTLPPSGPAGGSLTGLYPNPLIANSAITQAMLGPGITLPPNGPAGGSLTGSYPNPLIANGAVVQAMIGPGVTLPPSGPAGGDLSGNYPNPSVSKLLGRTINNTVPAINDVLTFDGANWGPVNLSSISGNVWATNGTNIYNINTGNVGIGTNAPSYKLHVTGGDGYFSDSVIAKAIRVGSASAQIAIQANGAIGIHSTGSHTAIYGKGTVLGIYGHSTTGIGVLGQSNDAEGVYGTGETGIYGDGTVYGVYGKSNGNIGVLGESIDFIGVLGESDNDVAVGGFSEDWRGGRFHSENNVGVWASTSRADNNWAGVFDGNVYTYNAYQTSDENVKKNIGDFEGAMNIIKLLKPKSYEFRHDGKLASLHLPQGIHYGVLAQDLEAILPRLVSELEKPLGPAFRKENINGEEVIRKTKTVEKITLKAVNYTGLIPIMIKGMQEQQKLIQNQQAKITELEDRLKKLEALLITMTKVQ